MSVLLESRSGTDPRPEPGAAARQLRGGLALARAEALILLRNATALFTAVAIPLLMVGLVAVVPSAGSPAALVISMVLGTSLIFVIYYTLVTAVVARREEHTLKRLYTSSLHPVVILVAMGLPVLALLLVQVGLGVVGSAVLVGLGDAPRLWLLLPAAVLGAAAWWGLALLSSGFTKTVESAQLTTLPLMLVALGLSGLSVPVAVLPDSLQLLAQLSPLFGVVDLAHLALGDVRANGAVVTGTGWLSAAGLDAAVLLGWLAVSLASLRRRFRWEPRR